MGPYIYSPIRLYGVLLPQLGTVATLPFTFTSSGPCVSKFLAGRKFFYVVCAEICTLQLALKQ